MSIMLKIRWDIKEGREDDFRGESKEVLLSDERGSSRRYLRSR